MASSQNTTYTSYSCPLWGKNFDVLVELDKFVETGSDTTTGDSYRFIRYELFQQHLSFLPTPKVDALLIRDEYQQLYKLLSEKSLPIGRVWSRRHWTARNRSAEASMCLAGGSSYGNIQASRCFCGIRFFAACANKNPPRFNTSRTPSGLSTTARSESIILHTGRTLDPIFQKAHGGCATRMHPSSRRLHLF